MYDNVPSHWKFAKKHVFPEYNKQSDRILIHMHSFAYIISSSNVMMWTNLLFKKHNTGIAWPTYK